MNKRTIVEVGRSLTETQRKKIVNKIAAEGMLAPNAAYRYLAGGSTPLFLYKQLTCRVINEVLSENFTVEELWPDA